MVQKHLPSQIIYLYSEIKPWVELRVQGTDKHSPREAVVNMGVVMWLP